MRWAIKNNERILAQPTQRAICPTCKNETIAKCGEIKEWHWAHKSAIDCDSWAEPESAWHIKWKKLFPKECQEVIIGKHRADIKTKAGKIIELQNSNLSPEEIEEREKFYKNMVWVLNGLTIGKNLKLRRKESYYTFRWKWPQKSWWFARKPIYIEFINYIFLIKKIYHDTPCGGWGVVIPKETFLKNAGVE